ncbi:MAG: hypothetical protein ACR2PC_08345 [Tsuneonella suprasediminis]|uniref:Secreted protein n=1 Tax=Tsuneonella suprasediminis TaxID=2306996 RepID=A0A419QYH0_9SPHN|nr:hypothetical protein [Tsuneonella suprasediminis]RJX65737.1 hypothetical protein D6858_15110 [Tsuneonella suprasediminis]UBS33546.1 hypothetical protein LBX01_02660 [Altererythrobacter sp. N1]
MRFIRPLVARPATVLSTVATVLLLSACSSQSEDPGPTGMTESESKALDDAAQMIEERRLPPDAIPNPSAEAATDTASQNPANN